MKHLIVILLLCGIGNQMNGQDTVRFSKNYHFTNGVYLDFESFKRNTPTRQLEEYDIKEHPQNAYDSKRFDLIEKKTHRIISNREIFAIVIEGVPFVNFDAYKDPKFAENHIIVSRLSVIGKLCFFIHDEYQKGGFYGGIERGGHFVRRKMILNYETGDIVDFTVSNFKRQIKDDAALLNTINTLSEREAAVKLYKCLLIYNDRNPLYISAH